MWAADGFILFVIVRLGLLKAVKARFAFALGGKTATHALTALSFALLFTLAHAGAGIAANRLWPPAVDPGPWAPLLDAPARGLGLAGLIILLQALARAAPRRWWIGLAAAGSVLIFVLILVPPVTLVPAGRGDHAAPAPKAAAILSFVRMGGLPATRLEVFPGADAADVDMEGLGPMISAAVSQAALDRPSAETYAAMGHLLGHHKNHDLWSTALVLSCLLAGLLVLLGPGAEGLSRRLGRPGAASAGDSAALAVLGLMVWAALPLEHIGFNLFDQAINFRADAYALRLTHDQDALCRWLVTREAHGVLDPSPLESALFESHPSTAERVRRVLAAGDSGSNILPDTRRTQNR